MNAANALSTAAIMTGALLFGVRAPLAVSLSVTDRCTLRCAYCGIWREPAEELGTESLERLIDELARLGTRRLTFTGGEPLLRGDLGVLVDRAAARGIFTAMNTNGLLLRERLGELKNLDYVKVSYDGPAGVHEAQRSGGRDHGEVLAGAAAARDAGIRTALNATLTRHNVGLLPEIAGAAASLGVAVDFNRLSPHARAGVGLEELEPSPEALRDALEWLSTHARRSAVSCSPPYIAYLRGTRGTPAPCRAGRLFCYIDTRGDVHPCFDARGRVECGNVSGGVLAAFRRIPAMACARCYCSAAVEFNFLASGNPGSIMNLSKWI